MSILLDPPTLTRRSTPGKAVFWLMFSVVLILGLGLAGTFALMSRGMDLEPTVVFRRIQVLLALVMAPLVLKKTGWTGLRDVGWSSGQTRGDRKRDFLLCFAIGLAFSLGIAFFSVSRGLLVWTPLQGWQVAGWFFREVVFFGVIMMVLRETVVRGVLFRTLSRVWNPWAAAAGVSTVMAWGLAAVIEHSRFEQGPGAVLHSILFAPFSSVESFRIFLAGLVLGMMLCRLVHRKGDIWAAAGLHAAMDIGLNRMTAPSGTTDDPAAALKSGFRFLAAERLWFLMGLLLLWGWIEWQNRRKLTSYGRVHF